MCGRIYGVCTSMSHGSAYMDILYVYVGRNHVWWISTLAFVSCSFSSGWLMGLLTDVYANLLLLPLLHDLHVCAHACLHQWISVLCISQLWLYFPTSAYGHSTCLLNRTGRKWKVCAALFCARMRSHDPNNSDCFSRWLTPNFPCCRKWWSH